MHAKPSFAHRLQAAKMTSSRTSAQYHGPTQVGFAELKQTADDRANISVTIIDAPIVGRWSGLYCRANCWFAYIGQVFWLILFRQSLVYSYWTDVWVTIDQPIYGS